MSVQAAPSVPSPPSNIEVRIDINEVTALGCPDSWGPFCGEADFFPMIELDGVLHGSEDWYVDDDNSVSSEDGGTIWTVPTISNPQVIGFSNNRAEFSIQIWDADSLLRGDNDHIDVHPGQAQDIRGYVEWDSANFNWANVVILGGPLGSNDLNDGTQIMAMDVVSIGEDKFQAAMVFEGSPKLQSQPTSYNTNPWQSPPSWVSQQSSDQTFIYDDQARISIQITLSHPFGATSVNQVVGFHTPIHPDPDDDLKITAGIVNEFGIPVQMDTLEIWLDPDGKNGGDPPQQLVNTGLPNPCWASGTQSGSMCEEWIDLSIYGEPDLDDDEQRMISYMIIGGDSVTGMKFDSGWRSLTVGNRTGAKYIAFSVGQGDMRNAVDILYAGHSPDYMNYPGVELDDDPHKGCSFKTEYFGVRNFFGGFSKGAQTRRPVCKHPPDVSLLRKGIERNWTAHFYNSRDWSPTGSGYYDVISENFSRFNFWYDSEPAFGGFDPLWRCFKRFTEPWEYDPSTGFIIGVDDSVSLPFDVRMLIHQTYWRDCAFFDSVSVLEFQEWNPVTMHELGHYPFGLADEYCCDGGYFQPHPHPNLYHHDTGEVDSGGSAEEDLVDIVDFAIGGGVGCSDDPLLGAPGDPFPPANSGPLCPSAYASTGDVGHYPSIAIGWDGLGLTSYYDNTKGTNDLKVAHCSNVECTSATTSSIDTTGIKEVQVAGEVVEVVVEKNVGRFTSITIGSDGLGLISYRDDTNRDLKVAHCSNVECTSATTSSIDTLGNVGRFTSITIGSDGLGLISYRDDTNRDLKVAHCSNVECTSATTSSIDTLGNVGSYTSVATGSDGLGLISYRDDTNRHLKVAHCSNVGCTSATTSFIDTLGDVLSNTSIAIPAANAPGGGLGLISYRDDTNRHLKVAHCSNVGCTSATTSSVAPTGLDDLEDNGAWSSIAVCSEGLGPGFITLSTICSDDLPLISYHDETSTSEGDLDGYNLAVAQCSDDSCTSVSSSVLDKSGAGYQFVGGILGEDITMDWYLPEPRQSLMGQQRTKTLLGTGETVLVQPGPQSRARIEWYLSRCQASRC